MEVQGMITQDYVIRVTGDGFTVYFKDKKIIGECKHFNQAQAIVVDHVTDRAEAAEKHAQVLIQEKETAINERDEWADMFNTQCLISSELRKTNRALLAQLDEARKTVQP